MKFYEIIFQGILFALIIYHIYKKEYKLIRSIILIFVLSFLRVLLITVYQIRIDTFSNILYLLVLFMAIYLGNSLGYYDRYKWWDRSIHFLSGSTFIGFGIALASLNSGITKLATLLFSFTFSITLHVIWEVLEYIYDCLTHGNAQRWQKIHASINHISDKAIQPAGLVDTMNDTICCFIGCLVGILIWWFIL
ncbi:MAG: hypothetical protein GX321_01755 [Clostridiales bacterium]|mgnify:FL=1|nr:hypothetical protein [Clostridiales bacterium]